MYVCVHACVRGHLVSIPIIYNPRDIYIIKQWVSFGK